MRVISNHERKVTVSDTVAKINVAKESSVRSVIGVKTWPEIVAEIGDCIGGIFGEAPATIWQVGRNLVKESVIVNGFISL